MVLLRWGVGAVGAGSVPGGAVCGARFGELCLGEGRVPSRDYVGRGKVPVEERGVGVGRRLVGRRRAGGRRAGRQRAGRRGLFAKAAIASVKARSARKPTSVKRRCAVRPVRWK